MDIQSVTASTRESAVRLLARFFAEEDFSTPEEHLAAHLDLMLKDKSCWVAVAIERGEAVAIVTVTTMLYVEWGRLGEIADLYVLPQNRRRGIGTQMATRAAAWCRELGCSAISVVMTSQGDLLHGLSTFYRGLAFEPLGRTILYRNL